MCLLSVIKWKQIFRSCGSVLHNTHAYAYAVDVPWTMSIYPLICHILHLLVIVIAWARIRTIFHFVNGNSASLLEYAIILPSLRVCFLVFLVRLSAYGHLPISKTVAFLMCTWLDCKFPMDLVDILWACVSCLGVIWIWAYATKTH